MASTFQRYNHYYIFTSIIVFICGVDLKLSESFFFRLRSSEKQRSAVQRRRGRRSGKDEATGGEPLATLIKIPAVEFYLRRARYWS